MRRPAPQQPSLAVDLLGALGDLASGFAQISQQLEQADRERRAIRGVTTHLLEPQPNKAVECRDDGLKPRLAVAIEAHLGDGRTLGESYEGVRH